MIDDCTVMEKEVFAYSYERVRYEITKFPFHDIRSVLQYVRKFCKKKYSANQALIRHFLQKQRVDFPMGAANGSTNTGSRPSLKISMVGDIMWMRKGWDDFLTDDVLSFLSGRDIVLGNLETPVSPSHAVIELMPDLVSYNSPPKMLDHLAQCFTALSIVNNHSLDQGGIGLHNTIRELDLRNIQHAGARVYDRGRDYALITRNGRRIAFLAYAWGVNNVPTSKLSQEAALNIMNLADPSKPVDYSLVTEHVRRAREESADLIICSLHWGYEFEMYPTFHMMNIARHLISLGVDVIMGHHPHVLQPFEIIDVNAERPICFDNIRDRSRPETRKAVVAYSLGNFVSAMYTKECRQSCVMNLDFVGHQGGLVLNAVSYLPTCCIKKQGRTFGPKVVSLIEELKKEHDPRLRKKLFSSYRDIDTHLGKNFIITH